MTPYERPGVLERIVEEVEDKSGAGQYNKLPRRNYRKTKWFISAHRHEKSVRHSSNKMWQSRRNKNVGQQLVKAIKSIYKETNIQVRTCSRLASKCTTTEGKGSNSSCYGG